MASTKGFRWIKQTQRRGEVKRGTGEGIGEDQGGSDVDGKRGKRAILRGA